MINALGRNALKLKIVQESKVNVKEKWCAEQQQDLERTFESLDELIEMATSSTSSAMAYRQLENRKEEFINEFLETSSKYRLIQETR